MRHIPIIKNHSYIVEAYNRGYRVTEDGKLMGLKKERSVKISDKHKYPTFSYSKNNRVISISVHQFAAYCFYGEQLFVKDLVVRHLNGNTLDFSKSNIVLGSHSQNNMDKSKEIRSNAARIARKSQGTRPYNAKLSDNDVIAIREAYKILNGKKAPNGFRTDLSIKYNINKGTISKIASGEYYNES